MIVNAGELKRRLQRVMEVLSLFPDDMRAVARVVVDADGPAEDVTIYLWRGGMKELVDAGIVTKESVGPDYPLENPLMGRRFLQKAFFDGVFVCEMDD